MAYCVMIQSPAVSHGTSVTLNYKPPDMNGIRCLINNRCVIFNCGNIKLLPARLVDAARPGSRGTGSGPASSTRPEQPVGYRMLPSTGNAISSPLTVISMAMVASTMPMILVSTREPSFLIIE